MWSKNSVLLPQQPAIIAPLIFGSFISDYTLVVTMVLECASILSLLNIAVDRYFSICWPTHSVITESRAQQLCAVVVAVALLLAVIPFCKLPCSEIADRNLLGQNAKFAVYFHLSNNFHRLLFTTVWCFKLVRFSWRNRCLLD